MERMMDGGSGGFGTDPMSSGSDMGMAGGERPARKAPTRKKSGGGRKRKKASKARGRAKSKARGKARGRAKKKGSRKARRR
jgi:hypothetical protein